MLVWNWSLLSHPHTKTSQFPKWCFSFMSANRAPCTVAVIGSVWKNTLARICPLLQRNPPWARSDFSQVELQPRFTEQKTSLVGSQLRICPWPTREILRLIGCQPKQHSLPSLSKKQTAIAINQVRVMPKVRHDWFALETLRSGFNASYPGSKSDVRPVQLYWTRPPLWFLCFVLVMRPTVL